VRATISQQQSVKSQNTNDMKAAELDDRATSPARECCCGVRIT